jgi:PEP-CTERM motif
VVLRLREPRKRSWLELGPAAPPVPEASTWAMLVLGFAGLGRAGYWRRTEG